MEDSVIRTRYESSAEENAIARNLNGGYTSSYLAAVAPSQYKANLLVQPVLTKYSDDIWVILERGESLPFPNSDGRLPRVRFYWHEFQGHNSAALIASLKDARLCAVADIFEDLVSRNFRVSFHDEGMDEGGT